MKKFDIEKALSGEPVKLENGNKAVITRKLKVPSISGMQLLGCSVTQGTKKVTPREWDVEGRELKYHTLGVTMYNIVGMWDETKQIESKWSVNGINVPNPVTAGELDWDDNYYYVTLSTSDGVSVRKFNKDCRDDLNLLNRGLVFKTRDEATVMYQALMNFTATEVGE